ncbi:MAG: peptidoglycan bridge formation glycyltransferase FemA/FemB family protein [Nanoarchaeota archaeon]|nr:peptidoglycan bridge formation glycyltransferase FemA/FemB family protein [Nanoarchaeota archaeon]MBU4116604.1 peptidoglycan bridge formation glycyltransferase FemA/FemB family protein [Nanoarchaeota archaeon]
MIYIIKNKIKWNSLIKDSDINSIFFKYEFAKFFFNNAKLIVFKDNERLALFCAIIKDKKIKSLRYGGILTNSLNKSFCELIKNRFIEYCRIHGIKKYVIRNHPFFNTIKIGELIKKEPFVFVDLNKPKRQLLNEISKKHIKNIKKAKAENLEIFETSDLKYLKIFYQLYQNQLQLKGIIPQKYMFFKKMFDYFGDNLSFVCVKNKNDIIAISIILDDNSNVFMMYGGMNKKGYVKCAKYWMIYNLMFEYKKKGYSRLILGTGNDGKDSVYKFKQGFAKSEAYVDTYGGEI